MGSNLRIMDDALSLPGRQGGFVPPEHRSVVSIQPVPPEHSVVGGTTIPPEHTSVVGGSIDLLRIQLLVRSPFLSRDRRVVCCNGRSLSRTSRAAGGPSRLVSRLPATWAVTRRPRVRPETRGVADLPSSRPAARRTASPSSCFSSQRDGNSCAGGPSRRRRSGVFLFFPPLFRFLVL